MKRSRRFAPEAKDFIPASLLWTSGIPLHLSAWERGGSPLIFLFSSLSLSLSLYKKVRGEYIAEPSCLSRHPLFFSPPRAVQAGRDWRCAWCCCCCCCCGVVHLLLLCTTSNIKGGVSHFAGLSELCWQIGKFYLFFPTSVCILTRGSVWHVCVYASGKLIKSGLLGPL